MTKINRVLQRDLLLQMRTAYPEALRGITIFDNTFGQDIVTANLVYLQEHGLCNAPLHRDLSGGVEAGSPTISARGLDFLEEDGGLSAILGVITVKLHADTVRDLIGAKIDAAPIPVEEKSALRRVLANLPEVALRTATTDLVRNGLDHLPDVLHWLRALGH